jgi:hypothetical protein
LFDVSGVFFEVSLRKTPWGHFAWPPQAGQLLPSYLLDFFYALSIAITLAAVKIVAAFFYLIYPNQVTAQAMEAFSG